MGVSDIIDSVVVLAVLVVVVVAVVVLAAVHFLEEGSKVGEAAALVRDGRGTTGSRLRRTTRSGRGQRKGGNLWPITIVVVVVQTADQLIGKDARGQRRI